MAMLEGGSTVAGYSIVHTGMPEIYLTGNINMGIKRMKYGPSSYGGYLSIGGDSPLVSSNMGSLWASDGNVHIDAGTSHGVFINWNSGAPATTAQPPLVIGNGVGGQILSVTKEGYLTIDSGTVMTPNSKNTGLQNSAGTHWFYPQDGSGNMNIRAATGTVVMDADTFIHRTAASANIMTVNNSGTILAQGWYRSKGDRGLYFEDFGGGWNMQDSTWIRAYNGKNIYTTSQISAEGYVTAGTSAAWGRLTAWYPGGNAVSRPGGAWAATIENTVDGISYNGLLVANRWGSSNSIIFEAASYFNGSAQAYTPALTVYGDRSVRIPRALVIPVGTDMYAT